MKQIFILLNILFLCNFVWGATIEKHIFDGMNTYFIKFKYNVECYEVHNGIKHYPATIYVFQRSFFANENKYDIIFIKSFKGWYTGGKCYEDELEYLIKYAIQTQYEKEDNKEVKYDFN